MLKRKQMLTFFVLLVSIALILAALLLRADLINSGPFYQTQTFTSPNPQIPSVNATIAIQFSAEGSISALNPITVTVTITGANISDLTQYYQAVGFYGSIYNSNNPSNSTANSSTLQIPGSVKFAKQPDGIYNGTGNLIWRTDSDVQVFLIPQSWYAWQLKAGPESSEKPITHISGVADTLAWKNQEEIFRFVLIITGFGVLFLIPVFEAILKTMRNK
jgi:hypothetical protein